MKKDTHYHLPPGKETETKPDNFFQLWQLKNKHPLKAGCSSLVAFSPNDVSVFDQFEHDYRTSIIRNPRGEVVFEMSNVEVPKQWSQISIFAQKYFRKLGVPQPDENVGKETSAKQVAHRLANCWKVWGERYNYFASKGCTGIYDQLVYSILSQMCVPNSQQWFNTGLHESYGITGKPQGHYYVDALEGQLKKSTSAYEHPQPHACFILSVNDDLVNEGGIMDLWLREQGYSNMVQVWELIFQIFAAVEKAQQKSVA